MRQDVEEADFADSPHLKIDEMSPPSARRQLSETREQTDTVSVFIDRTYSPSSLAAPGRGAGRTPATGSSRRDATNTSTAGRARKSPRAESRSRRVEIGCEERRGAERPLSWHRVADLPTSVDAGCPRALVPFRLRSVFDRHIGHVEHARSRPR